MTNYVLVWRNSDGSAVTTYSTENKKPRVWTERDADAPEMKAAHDVDESELAKLLAARDKFDAKRISVDLAEKMLGWSVS